MTTKSEVYALTPEEMEWHEERVSIMIHEGGMQEWEAQWCALGLVLDRRKKDE